MSDLYKLTLTEAVQGLAKKDFSAAEMVTSCLARIRATEPELNACISVLDENARQKAAALDADGPDPAKPLWGVPVTVKDVFCTKGHKTTCASKMLENYIPAIDAAVVERLEAAGAIIIAKTNLDEFAMGSTTEHSAFGAVKNPWNPAKVPGGSSGGAAASVAAGQAPGAFGTDTGGSIRQPAALCGCVGLKPTYGRVSRHGITALASSLDQAGPLARRVEDCARLLQAVAGPDERDSTASLRPVDDYVAAVSIKDFKGLKGLKLGVPEECWSVNLQPEMERGLRAALKKFEGAGAELVPIKIPHLKYAVSVYYILMSGEASSNLARFDGVRYGYRAEKPADLTDLYTRSRSLALGPEVRRRIILGTFALSAGYYDAYYKKAAQVRRLIREDYLAALKLCDFLVTPITTSPAWNFGFFGDDPLAAYQVDILTLPANLAGLPALSLPAGLGDESGLPLGLQLIGRAWDEKGLLALGRAAEDFLPPLSLA